MTVNVHSRGRQPATIEASAATLTAVRPPRQPLPGLAGFHGLHRQAGEGLGVTGLVGADLPSAALSTVDLVGLSWPTAAYGVPIGSNRAREPVYLGLASPEPVRITVTGTPEFHMGITARLALSGLPVAVYTADLPRWKVLANYAAPQQVLLTPPSPVAGAIIVSVSDGNAEAPTGAISVVLRRPQAAAAPATTIVITQDPRRPDLFEVTTAHGSQQLSTRW